MLVKRKEMLARIQSVAAGITTKPTIQQSDFLALKRGRFYSYSLEVACSIKSELPSELEGAVDAKKLMDYLKLSPDEELNITAENGSLVLKGKQSRKTKFALQELLLPVDSIEKPTGWLDLSQDFSEAVDLTHRCTKKKGAFANECVHVHPHWLEACDDTKALRYHLDTFVEKSCLVRGSSIKEIVQLGMTKGWETPQWLHFGNPFGLRMSIRKFPMEKGYPPLEQFFQLRGRPLSMPKSLSDIAKRAGVFESIEGDISVRLEGNKMYLLGRNEEGEHSEEEDVKYTGRPTSFIIPPGLIVELVKTTTECEITDVSLRVNGGAFVYVCSLETKPEVVEFSQPNEKEIPY